MKFGDYIKQLKECEPENIVLVNYQNEKFIYKGEVDYDNLYVTGDGFVKIKKYLNFDALCVEVFLSDNNEKSNCFVLEILKLKYEKDCELEKEREQNLKDYQEWSKKHEKEWKLEMIACMVVGFLLLVGLPWLLSKIG